jgi:hypothetical protein
VAEPPGIASNGIVIDSGSSSVPVATAWRTRCIVTFPKRRNFGWKARTDCIFRAILVPGRSVVVADVVRTGKETTELP